MSSLHLGGDALLGRQMPAWEGGQGPRDRAGSWAEAKAEVLRVDELMKERVWVRKKMGLRTH